MQTTCAEEHLPHVSVVLITHNRKDLLLRSVKSIFLSDYPKEKLEVIVVDDASEDTTEASVKEHFGSKVKVIRNTDEKFLAQSRNIGFTLATGTHILNMDDDCLIEKDTLRNLVRVLDSDEKIGVVGPSVYHLNGKLAYCGAWIFPFFRPMRIKKQTEVREAEFIPGTIGLFKREAATTAGLWDSRNFTFQAEDADVCLRIRGSGYRAVCVPWAKAYHIKNQSLLDVSSLRRAYEAGRSRILLYKRHLRRSSYLFYIATVNTFVMVLYVLFITLRARNFLDLIGAYVRGVAHGLSTPIHGST